MERVPISDVADDSGASVGAVASQSLHWRAARARRNGGAAGAGFLSRRVDAPSQRPVTCVAEGASVHAIKTPSRLVRFPDCAAKRNLCKTSYRKRWSSLRIGLRFGG